MQEDLDKLYASLIRKFGDAPQGVNWKNKEAQKVRFRQLSKIFDNSRDFSVNDLGCGFGDFVVHLQESGMNFTYNGYDIVGEMIEIAKTKFADLRISFYQVKEAKEMKVADYTVSSGIFNIPFDQKEDAWLKHILETLSVMDQKSYKGFAFNILTKYSDPEFMRTDLYYGDPLFFFDYCKRNFAKNIALLHDYDQYDFTIIVRK